MNQTLIDRCNTILQHIYDLFLTCKNLEKDNLECDSYESILLFLATLEISQKEREIIFKIVKSIRDLKQDIVSMEKGYDTVY